MNIDFAKCFDKISHTAIKGSLEYFKFPPDYVKWVMLCFTNLSIFTQNFGFLSDPFCKERGSNQGCNISPFCYLLCGEIMARKIKQDPHIKGIKYKDLNLIISQFADDTTLYLQFEELTFHHVLKILSCIETNTGLTISYDKTVVYRIGSIANSNAKIYTTNQLSWTNEPVNMLGILLNNDYENVSDFNTTIDKMRITLSNWYNRTLTLMGKVLVVNTLCESLFVYKMSVLPNLTGPMLADINKLVSNYLWGERKARIDKKTLQCSKKCGGLRLFDAENKQMSLKLSWIPTLLKDSLFKACFFENVHVHRDISVSILKTNLNVKDAKEFCNPNEFWGQVWLAWCKYRYQKDGNICDQTLWYNSNLKIGNNVLFIRKSYAKGILYVRDLFKPDGVLATPDELGLTWLQWHSIRTLLRNCTVVQNGSNDDTSDSWLNDIHFSSRVYHELIDCDTAVCVKYANRWYDKIGTIDIETYLKCFTDLYKITHITKFRDFQYRLLLCKLPTNVDLYTWKKRQDNLCSFCNDEPETLEHMFIKCKFVKRIWNYLKWRNVMNVPDLKTVVFNHFSSKVYHISNLIALILKQYIYRKRCQGKKPSLTEFQFTIKNWYHVEKFISNTKNKSKQFHKRWGDVNPLLLS